MAALIALILSFSLSSVYANPYWDPKKVAIDPIWPTFRPSESLHLKTKFEGIELMRVQIDWEASSDKFHLSSLTREKSGTQAWSARVQKENQLGSYRAYLKSKEGSLLGFDAIGTGQAFRRLTRALTFRLPLPSEPAILEIWGEHPATGQMEVLLTQEITAPEKSLARIDGLEVRQLRAATKQPALVINLYSDGYTKERRELFWQAAQKAVEVLRSTNFPLFENFEINGVFAVSKMALGSAKDLGQPIPERDSFLGLYFPYWLKFGRWYNVVYPTREARFRNAIGQIPYDYAIAIVDSQEYWGVGNFNELTAIPAQSRQFQYLLLHEFGHFFGLNEEYEGGGPTELEFAPGIIEPWSQNITFLDPAFGIKWGRYINIKTPVPTPRDVWRSEPPVYGAYRGGYADSEPQAHSHKPGFNCMMEAGQKFCAVCREAITEKIKWDLGR